MVTINLVITLVVPLHKIIMNLNYGNKLVLVPDESSSTMNSFILIHTNSNNSDLTTELLKLLGHASFI